MISTWQRFSSAHPRVTDAAVAVLLFVASVGGASLPSPGVAPQALWPAVLLAVIACGAALWHRSHPHAVLVLTTTCAMTAMVLGYLATPLLMAPALAALYWLALRASPKATYTCSGVVAVLLASTALLFDPGHLPPYLDVINSATWWVLLAAARGQTIRLRRAYLEAVHARAEHAERTREEEARHRVAEERMRIARELHDVVAHHLALANAQAGTAAHLARTHPEQVQQILTDLSGTTSSALRELKATVGLLRQAGDPDTSLEPAPGLARLSELITAVEAAGLHVILTTEGEPRPLSPGVDLTAFRIVQEALTNVTKHAATPSVYVHLTYTRTQLAITVTNGSTTAPTSSAGDGFGLIGMRERAHSLGGELHAGHRPDGRFEVTTALPLHAHTTEPEEDAAS